MEQNPSVAAHSVRHTNHVPVAAHSVRHANHVPVAAHSVRHGGRCQWRTLCAATCCILFVAVLLWSILSIRAIPSSQTLQYEAERWQGPSEQTYSQVSVFWNEGEMDAGQAQRLAEAFRASFPTEEAPPIVTAWGAKSSGLAVYAHRRTEAELWYVSGDFFGLHAFPMAEGGAGTFGSTGSEAVLNEAAAFALFGSNNCVGEDIQLGGLGWRVIAVLREPEGAANAAAFGTAPRIFLPIGDDGSVTFCEAILPEYYAGYAAQCLQNAAGRAVTTSTGRFRLSRLWEKVKDFFRSPPAQRPPLPPWEQAAILAARKLCARWCVLLLSGILLILCQIVQGVEHRPVHVENHSVDPVHVITSGSLGARLFTLCAGRRWGSSGPPWWPAEDRRSGRSGSRRRRPR